MPTGSSFMFTNMLTRTVFASFVVILYVEFHDSDLPTHELRIPRSQGGSVCVLGFNTQNRKSSAQFR